MTIRDIFVQCASHSRGLASSALQPTITGMEFLNIPYTAFPERDPLREFDLYLPLGAVDQRQAVSSPLICFVHGGAWRT